MAGRKIRVFVVDDSLLIRNVIEKELNKDAGIEVVGVASDPVEAKTMILKAKPDVVTLDVEMPKMDGLTFLGILQRFYPVPVVMLSTLTAEGSRLALLALQRGATEIMLKPGGGSFLALSQSVETLKYKIKAAAASRRRVKAAQEPAPEEPKVLAAPNQMANDTVIVLGASTGGTEALRHVFARLPAKMPPILIVQHMPESFTGPFANSLDQLSEITVVEAKSTVELSPGIAALARGGLHLHLAREGGRFLAVSKPGPQVCHQCPAVDILFHSAARVTGKTVIAALFTGMGEDGADGMVALREAGAYTIAQDEKSCVVFGMPKEAIDRNAAMKILPLDQIPQALVRAVEFKAATRSLATTGA